MKRLFILLICIFFIGCAWPGTYYVDIKQRVEIEEVRNDQGLETQGRLLISTNKTPIIL